MVGDEDEIAKAAPSGLITKAAPGDDDFVNVDLPKGASISISPADFAEAADVQAGTHGQGRRPG